MTKMFELAISREALTAKNIPEGFNHIEQQDFDFGYYISWARAIEWRLAAFMKPGGSHKLVDWRIVGVAHAEPANQSSPLVLQTAQKLPSTWITPKTASALAKQKIADTQVDASLEIPWMSIDVCNDYGSEKRYDFGSFFRQVLRHGMGLSSGGEFPKHIIFDNQPDKLLIVSYYHDLGYDIGVPQHLLLSDVLADLGKYPEEMRPFLEIVPQLAATHMKAKLIEQKELDKMPQLEPIFPAFSATAPEGLPKHLSLVAEAISDPLVDIFNAALDEVERKTS